MTEVIFRENKNGVYALFPYEISDNKGDVMSYQHIGQHSGADYNHCISTSKPAKDFTELKQELINIGYDLKIVKLRNHRRFLMHYYGFLREHNVKHY